MRYLLIFSTILLLSCNSNNKTDNQNKYDYSGLGMLIETYYQNSFEYPKNIQELISYIDMNKFPENFNPTIEKLKDNKNNLNLNIVKDNLLITLGGSTVFKTALRYPCDELSYNMGFYLGKVLFFDEKEVPIANEKIANEFKNNLKEIKKHYKNVEKEGNENKYVMLKYTPSQELVPYCSTNVQLNDYKYFQEAQEYLNVFSKTHKITKVIFVTPVFFN